MKTKHRGSDLYSGATTEIRNESGRTELGLTNRDYRNDGVYFTPRALNRNSFNPAQDGRYRITATYITFIPNAGVGNEVQQLPGTLGFRLCYSDNFPCTSAGRAENPKNEEVADREQQCPDEPLPSRAPTSAAAEEMGGCGGYGGGGYNEIPFHLRDVPLTRSMEPFFVMTRVGNSVSEDEVRAAMHRSTPGQLDDIAEIMLEVYNEDIYDYARTAPGNSDSPFLALSEALEAGLDAWPATDVEGRRSFLSGLSTRYVSESALLGGETKRGDAPPALGTAAQTRTPGAAIRAWPNPATQRVTVETAEAATDAEVYDAVGRRVARLSVTRSGDGSVATWNLSSGGGGRVAPGVYRIVVSGDARHAVSVTVL